MDFHFLHAADIHLDSPLRGLAAYEGAPVDRFRNATRAALERLVAQAIDGGAAFVVIAGDLFDGDWRDFSTGLFLARQLERLRAAGIRVVILAGNHDADSRITRSLPWPDNVHRFRTDRVETLEIAELGVALHGQGFATAAITTNLAGTYPPPIPGRLNIGVLHTALEGHAAHASYAPCRLAQLTGHGYDYWALGHVHERAILSQAPWVAYPGNLQGRHARETGPKGCLSVTVRDGGIVSVEPVDLDVVRWLHAEADVAAAADADAVEELTVHAIARALAEEAGGRPAAVRVTLRGCTPAHGALAMGFDQLEQALRARAMGLAEDCWLERIRLETGPPAEPDAEAVAEGGDLLGVLLAEAETDPDLAAALAEALRPLKEKLPADLLPADPQVPAEEAPLVSALRDGDMVQLISRIRPDLSALAGSAAETV
jgi:DNA repair exonuclease SbcCD nuclease subunit